MNVLVTGGAGFIGSHLVDTLVDKGYRVVAVDNLVLGRKENLAHLSENTQFRFVEMDVRNLQGLFNLFREESFDVVFHLAANSDVQQEAIDTERDLELTFLTTYSVLECMRLSGNRQFVFASSSAIYGETEGLLDEDFGPLRPISLYGAAKLAAEGYTTAFAHNFGIKVWICRFPNVLGERATHGVVFDFINRLRKNQKELKILGNGEQRKPYLYVRDLVDALLFIWETAKEPVNCYNIGVEGVTEVTKIAQMVVEEMGLSNVCFRYSGGDRGWVGDVPRFAYDTSKLSGLGWKAPRSSEESVRIAIKRILAESPKRIIQ